MKQIFPIVLMFCVTLAYSQHNNQGGGRPSGGGGGQQHASAPHASAPHANSTPHGTAKPSANHAHNTAPHNAAPHSTSHTSVGTSHTGTTHATSHTGTSHTGTTHAGNGHTGMAQAHSGHGNGGGPHGGGRSHVTESAKHSWDGHHFSSGYFHDHFGNGHRFGWGSVDWDGPRFSVGSSFFFGGVWFGIVQPIPVGWVGDPVYVDVGTNGDYYLYDQKFGCEAIPVTPSVQDQSDDGSSN